jgi:hypothetical protein
VIVCNYFFFIVYFYSQNAQKEFFCILKPLKFEVLKSCFTLSCFVCVFFLFLLVSFVQPYRGETRAFGEDGEGLHAEDGGLGPPDPRQVRQHNVRQSGSCRG